MARKQRQTTTQRKELRTKENRYIEDLKVRTQQFDNPRATYFAELPLSNVVLRGLKDASYLKLTDIQRESIPVSLRGNDLLGSAKTGSGKTLAFLVPVLETLYRERWSEYDGVGALIISPTRELAMQIYEVLIKIGSHCSFSAGLVIGGKDVKFESERISKINILIGTPGRILQHMDQAVGLSVDNLKILVLDEADRCLDMGFQRTLDAIINNLPISRQSLLFSATQSQSLNDLARLSLTDYKTVGSPSNSNVAQSSVTPETLEQYYIIVELADKLDTFFSFIKSHLKSKIIAFLSSSKQVHFIYETFRKLQPGMSLMHLHGRQKQRARTETLDKFSRAQQVCLIATDVVSRGIDFPAVDWVIQVDCPEDTDTYIHRVGRSARFGKHGKSLIMLTPQENESFLRKLKLKTIEPGLLSIKESKKKSIKPQLQTLLFKDPELKYLGQKAFIAYVKSIYIQKDHDVFKFNQLPTEGFAQSLGLPGVPRIKIKGMGTIERSKNLKNTSRQLLKLKLGKTNEDNDGSSHTGKGKEPKTKIDRMFERKNQTVLSEHYLNITKSQNAEDEQDGDFLSLKRSNHELNEQDLPPLVIPQSKRAMRKALSKKASLSSKGNATKMVFDEEGQGHPVYELQDEELFHEKGDASNQKIEFLSKEREIMAQVDIQDKQIAKRKRQEKKIKHMEELKHKMGQMKEYDAIEEAPMVFVGTGNLSDDIDSEDDEEQEPSIREPPKKKHANQKEKDGGTGAIIEIEEPETLEDLESLTARLLNHSSV